MCKCCIHYIILASVRMNLATASSPSAKSISFFPFIIKMIKEKGAMSLYDGLMAGKPFMQRQELDYLKCFAMS